MEPYPGGSARRIKERMKTNNKHAPAGQDATAPDNGT
jgi:hypothetical protein